MRNTSLSAKRSATVARDPSEPESGPLYKEDEDAGLGLGVGYEQSGCRYLTLSEAPG